MILLTDRIYKGLHNGMDRVAYNLLVAKFQGSAAAQSIINQYAISDLQHRMRGVDVVVGIAPRDSGSSIVRKLSEAIATHYGLPVVQLMTGQIPPKNRSYEGKNILLVDDVLYTGRTIQRATAALSQCKAARIKVYTLAKSKTFK